MVKFKKLDIEKLNKIAQERKESGLQKLIGPLDHIAYRVEFGEMQDMMEWVVKNTPNDFLKYYDVGSQNARTIVMRFKNWDPAIVISEGLEHESLVDEYVHDFGSRVHHIAWRVKNIEKVVEIQKGQGLEFTTKDIIGSKEQGLKQIFTYPEPVSNHIHEYIQRFGGHYDFFIPENVGNLMKSTKKFNVPDRKRRNK